MNANVRSRRTPRRAALSNDMARFAVPALGVLGAALILLREANHGVGLTWDSGSYISVARNLLAGDGLLEWNGTRYQGAAPLFPLLLAAVGLFGIDVIDAAGYVNAAAFGLTVFVVAAWLKRHVRSPLLAVWAGCACALSPALASAAAHAWTEVVCILFIVIALSLLDRFLSSGKVLALLLAAAAAAAACLTRYLGGVMIGAGALVLLLRNDIVIRTRLRDTAIWSVASMAPVGVWIMRNLLVIGSVLGSQFPDGFSGLISLHRATDEFALWLLGPTGFDVLNGAIGSITSIGPAGAATVTATAAKLAVLAAPAIGAGYALARYRPGFLRKNRTVLTVSIVFVAAYSLFLAIYLPLADTMLAVRYLLPLFPPLLVAATMVLDGLMSNAHARNAAASKKIGKAVPVVASIVVSLWLVQQVGATYNATRVWLDDGSGYTSRGWTESDVIRYLNANRLDGTVWSSDPQALYFLTELRRVWTISLSLADVTDQLANRDPAESAYVVLFENSFRARNYDYVFDELGALPGVELVADLNDGVIFRITAAGGPSGSASLAGDQVVRSHFDIYLYGDALAYFKEPCTAEDVKAGFFLHVVPADAADLPARWRQVQSGFDNLDFTFSERGVILDGRCLAVVTLPGYRIGHITTGQYFPAYGPLWKAEIAEQRLHPYRSAYRSILAGDYGAPAARSIFDLYLAGNALTYLRDPCVAEDVHDPFFLHVVPADAADLPARWRQVQSGFDNLDFSFAERGAFLDGTCVAITSLPDYEIARIRTGQYTPGEGNVWDSTFSP